MNTVTVHNHESSFLRAATHSLRHENGEYEYDGRKKYLQSIYALSPLHWKETQKLLKEYRGDPKNKSLRDKIITGNLYLVARTVLPIARRKSWSDFEDLLTEGYLGLSQAVEKFDKLGTSDFGAYAGFWIMQYVNRYVDDNLSTVRVPSYAQKKLNIRGDADLGRFDPNAEPDREFPYALVEQIDPYETWVITARDCRSLDKVIGDEYGCEDPAYKNAFTRLFDVKLYWGDLNEREKLIVLARNGLSEDRQWTLEELSTRVGRTRERVRQLEKIGCDKLHKRLLEEGYESPEDCTDGCLEEIEMPMEFFISPRHLIVADTNLRERSKSPAYSAYRRSFAASPAAIKCFVCKRRMGYSFFNLGIIIPIEAEEVFLRGMGKDKLPQGVPHVVRIIVEKLMFVAKAIVPWTASQVRSNINIKWSKHNPIIEFLRSRHRHCYNSLAADRNWADDESVFALYTTDEPGTFVLDDKPVESAVPMCADEMPVADDAKNPEFEADVSPLAVDHDEEVPVMELHFTFDAFPKDLDYSQPLSLTMPNGTFPVKYWSEVQDRCFAYAFLHNVAKVKELADVETPFRKAVLISRHPETLRKAKMLGGDLYMETNMSAHGIVKSVCGLMAYCGFPVKEFSVTYRIKSSASPVPESKADAPVSSSEFSKPLDFSTFTTGITIPVRAHEAFLKHLSVKLERGQSHPVTIMVGDSSFQVSINNIGFSDPNRKQVLAFLWRKNSPLAKSFQATFPAAYRQLMEDHANRAGVDTVLTVSCGEQPDVFQIDLGTPLVECKEPDAPAQAETAAPAQPEATTPDVAPFITVLLRDFSAGFEFNDSSVRLLESAVGRSCPESVRKELKRIMFKRYDGIFLLQEMVAEPETLAELKRRIEEYFSHYHAFSLSVLYDEFADRLSALTNPDSDFRLFLLNAILPELPEGGDIFGRQQKQICIPGASSQREVLEFLAEQFREKLRENGDAVLMDELLAELPCLNFAAAEDILREQIPDAVEIKMDGLQYWKLLESFCLPEDFGEILGQIIGGIEQQGKIPSLQAVATGLEVQYGNDFREIYALDDDEVFRQVIFKSIGNGDYTWKNNLLVKRAEKRETNVADEFLQTRHGIFEETEFFDYAAQHRGLTNSSMFICCYLRPRCIRLDMSHWLSLADFEKLADFTAETAAKMTQLLKSRLAHQLFLPLGTLPNAFYSELPPIHIQDRPFYWNEYLLASIAEHKLPALQVANTDPSPYTVTAMVLPDVNDYDGDDVIGFVFRALRRASSRFDSADQVFEYLKEHKVRMTKTKKLMDRINSFWGLA